MQGLVSVIVPVYNVESYIDACMESIVNQTYKNLEIILVDDGATDMSGEKCDEWGKKDYRVIVIHQDNKGLSGARNSALDICKGQWIVFVDSDDVIDKRYVEILYSLVERHQVKLAQCGNGVIRGATLSMGGNAVEGIMGAAEFLSSDMYDVMAWAKIYARELFETERYPNGRIHEDMALTYKLIYQAEYVAYTSEKLYFCNTRPDSINAEDRFYVQRLDILRFRKEQLEFYRKENEEVLENLALRAYAFELLRCYGKVVDVLKNTCIAKQIYVEYRKIWKELKKDKHISGKVRFLLKICYYNPILWSRVVEK